MSFARQAFNEKVVVGFETMDRRTKLPALP
jgi:hypothetical protein